MTVKEKLIEYAKDNNLYVKDLSKLVGFEFYACKGHRLKVNTQLKHLFRCWQYIGDTEEFKREVAISIRNKFVSLDYIDRDKISDDDCLKIFNILKKYYKG